MEELRLADMAAGAVAPASPAILSPVPASPDVPMQAAVTVAALPPVVNAPTDSFLAAMRSLNAGDAALTTATPASPANEDSGSPAQTRMMRATSDSKSLVGGGGKWQKAEERQRVSHSEVRLFWLACLCLF